MLVFTIVAKVSVGLVNGVYMAVRGLMENTVNLEILTGLGRGTIIFMLRIKLISTNPKMPFYMSRLQFH